MKNFSNLVFKQRRNKYNGKFESGKVAFEKLTTNISVSVLLGGKNIYSNGVDLYELAILYNYRIVYVWSNDVYAFIDKDKINEIMFHLQNLTEDEISLFEENYMHILRVEEEWQRYAEEYCAELSDVNVVL